MTESERVARIEAIGQFEARQYLAYRRRERAAIVRDMMLFVVAISIVAVSASLL